MDRPFTVYFDTNFYVWLGRAGSEDADRVLRVLNERNIRYVQSSYIVLELLSGRERNDQDKNLVDRLRRWNIEPYPIGLGYSRDADLIPWDILLLAGEERQEYSEGLKEIFDQETIARSFSYTADKRLSTDQQSDVKQALRPFLDHIGINDESSEAEQAKAYINFSTNLIFRLSQSLPADSAEKVAKIDFSKPATAENLKELSEQIKAVLSDRVISNIEQEGQLLNSVLAHDDRPVRAATGQGSPQQVKKLGNSMRDAVHMNAFLNHAAHIDLLQVDSRQLSLILRKKPEHFMRDQGMSNRCFSTPDLASTVIYVINHDRGGE